VPDNIIRCVKDREINNKTEQIHIHSTATRKIMLEQLKDSLSKRKSLINVFGPSGVGKSFSMIYFYIFLKYKYYWNVFYFNFGNYNKRDDMENYS
jgi:hypothetical protein